MRIVLIGPAYPLRGGIAQYLAILYQRLKDSGNDVHFVSFVKQFPEWLFPGKTQRETSAEYLDVSPVARFAPLGIRSWRRSALETAKYDPDLVLFKWWMPFFGPGYWAVQRWLRRHTRARVVYILDNVIPHEHRPGDKTLTKLAVSEADFFVAQSRAVERDFFKWFPHIERKRVAFCPHPLYDCYPPFTGDQNAARRTIGVPEAGELLLFFGFVRHYKGLDLLLRALPEMRRSRPELKLVIAGEFYESREIYDRIVRELGLEKCVFVHDQYCPNEKVGAYFAAADVAVLPYRSATQSGIIQICYALGLPVITTDVGGLSEVVLDGITGLVVPAEDNPALINAVDRFYNLGGRDVFTANVRREAGRFGWEGLIETLTRFAAHSADPR